MQPSIRKSKKIKEPVGKNKPAGHPKKNSGYAEDQPIEYSNKTQRRTKKTS